MLDHHHLHLHHHLSDYHHHLLFEQMSQLLMMINLVKLFSMRLELFKLLPSLNLLILLLIGKMEVMELLL